MASKLSQLPESAAIDNEDLVPIVSDGKNKVIRFKAILKTLSRKELGIENVENTADLDKPVSTATRSALNGKADLRHRHTAGELEGIPELVENEVKVALSKNAGVPLSENDW